jgi:hypothetical protein
MLAGGSGQPVPVDLAAGRDGQGVEAHEGRGDHVVGQARVEEPAQRGRRGAGARVGTRYATSRVPPAPSSRPTTDALPDLLVLEQAPLDLVGVHEIAADLHLVIEAADQLEAAVGREPAEVAGAVRPRGVARRVGREGGRVPSGRRQ